MNNKQKHILYWFIVLVVILIGYTQYNPDKPVDIVPVDSGIQNFEDCANAGNPVMESYPRKCRANDITYVEDVGRTYCEPEQRNAEICTMEYRPVCGRKANDEPIKTYSNPCAGCSPEEVIYWTEGEC